MGDSEQVKIEKLQKDEEWPSWKFLVRIVLQAADLMGFVNGTAREPLEAQFSDATTHVKALEKFRKDEFRAQRIIVTALGKEAMLHVMNCGDACQMWKKLHSVYEQKSKVTIHLVQERFFDFKMESTDCIAVTISKLQSIAQQLKDLGETISDQMVITKLLLALPVEFSHFHSAWDSTAADQQTIENLTARLIMEEARMAKQNRNEVGEALVAKSYPKRTFTNSKSFNKSIEKPGKCFFFVMSLDIGSEIAPKDNKMADLQLVALQMEIPLGRQVVPW